MSEEIIRESIDLEFVLDNLDDDKELLAELAQVLTDELDNFTGSIEQAIESNDPEALAIASHTFKGALSNVGALKAQNLAYEMEKLAKDEKVSEAISTYDSLKAHIPTLKKSLELLTTFYS